MVALAELLGGFGHSVVFSSVVGRVPFHGVQRPAQLVRGVAALRGVRLVGQDRAPLLGQILEEFERVGEGLHGDGEDPGGGVLECRRQLGGLAAALTGDGPEGAGGAYEALHGLPELVVQDGPVGDDEDLVEDGRGGAEFAGASFQFPGVGEGVQVEQAQREPGDGVGLAGARGVLDEVLLAAAVALDVVGEGAHGVPLVVAGEDQFCAAVGLLLREEALQDLHEVVPPQHLAPQVGGGVAALPFGDGPAVALASGRVGAVGALVEGQEHGVAAGQPGGRVHLVGVHGEVHERAAREQRLAGVAVVAVLAHGVGDGLPGRRVLQLGGGHRQPVDEEHQVEGVAVAGGVVELRGDAEDVLLVVRQGVDGFGPFGFEVGECDLHSLVPDPVAQHVQGAVPVELVGESAQEASLELLDSAVAVGEPLDLVALGGSAEELEEPRGVDGALGVVAAVLGHGPPAAVFHQLRNDRVFEGGFEVGGGVTHGAAPGGVALLGSSPVWPIARSGRAGFPAVRGPWAGSWQFVRASREPGRQR